MFRMIQTAFKGPTQAWAQHRQLLKGYTGIESGLAALQSVCPASKDDPAAPIFLLSAGRLALGLDADAAADHVRQTGADLG